MRWIGGGGGGGGGGVVVDRGELYLTIKAAFARKLHSRRKVISHEYTIRGDGSKSGGLVIGEVVVMPIATATHHQRRSNNEECCDCHYHNHRTRCH